MKRILILALVVLSIAGAASASYISIYSDASGGSCVLAPGFNPNVTIIQKFTLGTVSVRFSLTRGPNEFLAFNSPYATIGNLTSDITVQYGGCRTGSLVIGTATMNLVGDKLYIHPAQGQTIVIDTDCAFVDHKAMWGYASVGNPYDVCNQQLATESSTWGRVKSLYR
jgi:hypothetical protein